MMHTYLTGNAITLYPCFSEQFHFFSSTDMKYVQARGVFQRQSYSLGVDAIYLDCVFADASQMVSHRRNAYGLQPYSQGLWTLRNGRTNTGLSRIWPQVSGLSTYFVEEPIDFDTADIFGSVASSSEIVVDAPI